MDALRETPEKVAEAQEKVADAIEKTLEAMLTMRTMREEARARKTSPC